MDKFTKELPVVNESRSTQNIFVSCEFSGVVVWTGSNQDDCPVNRYVLYNCASITSSQKLKTTVVHVLAVTSCRTCSTNVTEVRRFNQQTGLQISDEHIPKRFDKNETMTTKGGITLLNFFVYNSEYSPREGEVCFFPYCV